MGVLLALVTVRRWPHGNQGLWLFQDDFFYYAKIAASIADGNGSTFNQITITNGYHPLWMAVLIILSFLLRSTHDVIAAVCILIAVSSFATFSFAKGLFERLNTDSMASSVVAACLTFLCFSVISSGMEVILTAPLALALLSQLTLKRTDLIHTLRVSTLASLLILSRLDAAIFVALLGVSYACMFQRTPSLRSWIALACGALPLAAYLCWNEAVFHVLLPISSSAKQLRVQHGLTFVPVRSLAHVAATGKVILGLVFVGAVLLPFGLRQVEQRWKAILVACLAFPFVHLLVLSFVSDWPVWSWYLYSWCLGAFATLALTLVMLHDREQRIAIAAAAVFTLYAALHLIVQKPAPPRGRVLAGMFLAHFADTHPGTYAMGDRSGIVAILTPNPIIQTEGLVMDKAFLLHLKRQDPLIPTLRSYGVHYYVANFYNRAAPSGCFEAIEPTMAGKTAKHMSSVLCSAPLAQYADDGVDVAVYDLSSQR